MGKCKHLIDISPYDPLCDHPCRLYGGGAVEAECETCQYHIEDLERENAKLRELVRDMNKWLWNGADCTERPFVAKCDLNADFESDIHAHVCLGWSEIHRRMRELGVEVDA